MQTFEKYCFVVDSVSLIFSYGINNDFHIVGFAIWLLNQGGIKKEDTPLNQKTDSMIRLGFVSNMYPLLFASVHVHIIIKHILWYCDKEIWISAFPFEQYRLLGFGQMKFLGKIIL